MKQLVVWEVQLLLVNCARGVKRPLPVYVEESILRLPRLLINGGRRGFLVEIEPEVLASILETMSVNVAR